MSVWLSLSVSKLCLTPTFEVIFCFSFLQFYSCQRKSQTLSVLTFITADSNWSSTFTHIYHTHTQNHANFHSHMVSGCTLGEMKNSCEIWSALCIEQKNQKQQKQQKFSLKMSGWIRDTQRATYAYLCVTVNRRSHFTLLFGMFLPLEAFLHILHWLSKICNCFRVITLQTRGFLRKQLLHVAWKNRFNTKFSLQRVNNSPNTFCAKCHL